MRHDLSVAVVVPALDEEHALPGVLDAIPQWADRVIVVDNGSTDRTADVARAGGATVVLEPRRGYGRACLAGIKLAVDADIIVFLDADGSSDPAQMAAIVDPIALGRFDLVLGSRMLGRSEAGAMTPPQRFGNMLAPALIRGLWGVVFTDLGPFRAVGSAALRRLCMDDQDFGWTVQMQVRAVQAGLRCLEVPVDYARRKAGRSKISGTVRGVMGAGSKILSVIARERLRPAVRRPVLRGRLAVMTKFPTPGTVKTRLIPHLGAEGAADLHARMVARTLHMSADLCARMPIETEVWVAGSSAADFRARFGPHVVVRTQPAGTLGDRLVAAFEGMLAKSPAAVAIGTDCPAIAPEVLWRAFDSLRTHDVVLGPATDGGYYLIGMQRPAPQLFAGVEWSTSAVLAQTLARAAASGLTVDMLAPLGDVDRPEDLPMWERVEAEELTAGPLPLLSIVIPTLNEASRIADVVAGVVRETVEVIVADGGSSDGTGAVAARAGARVVNAAPGRGTQLNAGAAAARADTLLFLHADTVLPADYSAIVRTCLDEERTAMGAFHFKLDRKSALLRGVEVAVHLRCTLFKTPRGDQALFMRSQDFKRLGGFAPISAMEDVDIVRRAKRVGRVRVVAAPAVTSARRWQDAGVVRTTLVNQLCLVGFALGVSADRLASMRNRLTGSSA